MIECGSPCWNVLVVEDDPELGALHRRIADSTPRFETIQVVQNGELALKAVHEVSVDVAILDLTMPGGDGITFLHRLRAEDADVEVIVVTAARDTETVRQAMHLGVLDYLVKPFAPERLRQALEAFARRARAFSRPQVAQADVDLVRAAASVPRLPKGLRPGTLELVQHALRANAGGLCADELARAIGMSRVTGRRYLEYLDVVGRVQMEEVSGRAGRPAHRYCWRAAGAA
jgi:response regulator of citrate/malate metabolism